MPRRPLGARGYSTSRVREFTNRARGLHSTQRFTDPSNDHRALHAVDDPNRKTNYVAAIIRISAVVVNTPDLGRDGFQCALRL